MEGTSIAEEVKVVLQCHAQAGPYLPSPGGAPKPPNHGGLVVETFRCEFSASLFSELELLAEWHAEPELCNHLFAYVGNAPILEFYDFPQNEIWLSLAMTEEQVRTMATDLNTSFHERDDGQRHGFPTDFA